MAREFIHFVVWGAQIWSSQGQLCSLMGIQAPLLNLSPIVVLYSKWKTLTGVTGHWMGLLGAL